MKILSKSREIERGYARESHPSSPNPYLGAFEPEPDTVERKILTNRKTVITNARAAQMQKKKNIQWKSRSWLDF